MNRMGDTISRQAAIEVLAAMQGQCTSKAALIQNSKIWQQIKDLPSADVQPVVRCKNCDSAECSGVMIYCLTHGCYMRDNDFCNYGERKDGEQNG